ncbi:RNase H family protein [Rhizobium halophytocola]|uniref:ribonuclease H n=1 Tax=Rhizobium halophytocola TaxID=735519 RepID=A0ABS4DVT7_9HYPH|nr:RNase H family protein [Rhizobium halophytocola]MBP1849806.1 ribonuclease HI [Rhizobium halophytocola]
MHDSLQIFTDGSFDAASASGSWAFVVMEGERQVFSDSGVDKGASNNAFEVLAAAKAMGWIGGAAKDRPVTLWTDSRHVLEGCHHWRAIWRNNGWKRITANPRLRRRAIPDAALWQQLDSLLESNRHVVVKLCKGHAGLAGNEQADALARDAYRAAARLPRS